MRCVCSEKNKTGVCYGEVISRSILRGNLTVPPVLGDAVADGPRNVAFAAKPVGRRSTKVARQPAVRRPQRIA